MNDWSIDIDLEAIKEYLQECAENDNYHYEQCQVDLVMHEYIQQKQIIERLKQGYCELKEKCNKGECDCTHEEYNGMCEQNIKMDLEIERLKEEYVMLQNASDEVEEEKDKEIERLNENNQAMLGEMVRTWEKLDEKEKIIKEVREKIRNVNITYLGVRGGKTFIQKLLIDILKILDKENNNER